MDKLEQEAKELLSSISEAKSKEEIQKLVIERLKQWYNYGKGYKRDREFLSSEEYEKDYAKKRKKPFKVYKKKEV